MNTVKIYKVTVIQAYMISEQGTGHSLSPWSGDNEDYKGYDDGGRDYFLPEGYSVGRDNDDMPHIYDQNDNYCELTTTNGNPAIITDAQTPVLLKRVPIPAAAALGRLGGSVKSEAKAAAVRENGKKGGRPRKQPKED